MKRQFKPVAFLFYALILVIFFASLSTLLQPPGPPEIKNYSQVVSFFEEEQVKSFTIQGFGARWCYIFASIRM